MKTVWIAIFLLLPFGDVFALKNEDMGLELRYSKSDVVLIGTAVAIDEKQGLALVTPTVFLKGSRSDSYLVRFRTGIMEHVVDCCDMRRKYMFFLAKEGESIDVYRSVNGKFGIYETSDP